MSRDPLLFVEDIARACEKVVRYTANRSRDEVFRDEMRFDAILFNLHVLGEAVKNLPDTLRADHPEIAWRKIAGMRDVVAHAYFALDLDILWNALQVDVPALLPRVRQILDAEN